MKLTKSLAEKCSGIIGTTANYFSYGSGDYIENLLNKEIKPKNICASLATLGVLGLYVPAATAESYYGKRDNFDKRGAIVGLTSEVNTKGGVNIGGFADWKLGDKYRIGPYVDITVANGETGETDTQITEREVVLISPGVYKYRTDEITTDENSEIEGEVGIRLRRKLGKDFRLISTLGAALQREKEEITGTSTIYYEVNGVAGEPTITSNTLEDTEKKWVPSIGLGLEYKLLDNVSISLLARYRGEEGLTGNFGVIWNF